MFDNYWINQYFLLYILYENYTWFKGTAGQGY